MLFDPNLLATVETNSSNSYNDSVNFAIPKIEKSGDLQAVKILMYIEMDGTAPSTSPSLSLWSNLVTWTWSDTNAYVTQSVDVTSILSTSDKDNWNLEGQLTVTLNDTVGQNGQILRIKEIGIEIEHKLEKGFEKTVETIEYYKIEYESSPQEYDRMYFEGKGAQDRETETIRVATHTTKESPKGLDYVFIGGKGRKYGSWIDANSRDNGYNSGDLIENPVYIIEDILRTELGLGDSYIDYTTFDTIGNTTNGTLGTAHNDSVLDIKFAFSQSKFIDGLGLIDKVCKQSGLYFFFNGEGKATLRQRLRASDYSSANKAIDFNDCKFNGYKRTNIGALRNNISINYKYDYGSEKTLDVKTATDTTSKNKYSADSKASNFILDADCIQDGTTATNLANSYLDWLKNRKLTLSLDIIRPKYLDLEMGDIVTLSNVPSNLKAYGTAISSSDYFIITQISKQPNGVKASLVEVS